MAKEQTLKSASQPPLTHLCFLHTLFSPEVLFVVHHALDDTAHWDTVDQLVPQWGQLGVKVHLQVQTRRSGHNHIFGLKQKQIWGFHLKKGHFQMTLQSGQ